VFVSCANAAAVWVSVSLGLVNVSYEDLFELFEEAHLGERISIIFILINSF